MTFNEVNVESVDNSVGGRKKGGNAPESPLPFRVGGTCDSSTAESKRQPSIEQRITVWLPIRADSVLTTQFARKQRPLLFIFERTIRDREQIF